MWNLHTKLNSFYYYQQLVVFHVYGVKIKITTTCPVHLCVFLLHGQHEANYDETSVIRVSKHLCEREKVERKVP